MGWVSFECVAHWQSRDLGYKRGHAASLDYDPDARAYRLWVLGDGGDHRRGTFRDRQEGLDRFNAEKARLEKLPLRLPPVELPRHGTEEYKRGYAAGYAAGRKWAAGARRAQAAE